MFDLLHLLTYHFTALMASIIFLSHSETTLHWGLNALRAALCQKDTNTHMCFFLFFCCFFIITIALMMFRLLFVGKSKLQLKYVLNCRLQAAIIWKLFIISKSIGPSVMCSILFSVQTLNYCNFSFKITHVVFSLSVTCYWNTLTFIFRALYTN